MPDDRKGGTAAAGAAARTAARVAGRAVALYGALRISLSLYQRWSRRALRRIVLDVAPVLDGLGIQYWADFGTLLGEVASHRGLAYQSCTRVNYHHGFCLRTMLDVAPCARWTGWVQRAWYFAK